MTAFHTARSLKAGTGTVEGVFAQNLVETSPASWAETDLTLKAPVQFDEGKDTQGPDLAGRGGHRDRRRSAAPAPAPRRRLGRLRRAVRVAVARRRGAAKREGRVVAFGDGDFASNTFLGFQGNHDFFLNTVAWLAEDADLISIRPKEPDDQRMFLTRQPAAERRCSLALLLIPGALRGRWASRAGGAGDEADAVLEDVRRWWRVAAGLGAYVYFVESKRAEPAARSRRRRSSPSTRPRCRSSTLAPAGAEAIRLVKEEDGWRLAAPARRGRGRRARSTRCCPASRAWRSEEVVAETPGRPRRVRPRHAEDTRHACACEGASEPLRLLLGDKTPDGGALYAKMPPPAARLHRRRPTWRARSTRSRSTCATATCCTSSATTCARSRSPGPRAPTPWPATSEGEWALHAAAGDAGRPLVGGRPARDAGGPAHGVGGRRGRRGPQAVRPRQARAHGHPRPRRRRRRKTLEIGSSPRPDKKYHARERGQPAGGGHPGRDGGRPGQGDGASCAPSACSRSRPTRWSGFDVETDGGRSGPTRAPRAKDKDGVDVYKWKRTRARRQGPRDEQGPGRAVRGRRASRSRSSWTRPAAPPPTACDAPALKVTLRFDGGQAAGLASSSAEKDGAVLRAAVGGRRRS